MSLYDQFSKRWLFETPVDTGEAVHNPYNDLVQSININLANGYSYDTLSSMLPVINRMVIDDSSIFYWSTKDNTIQIIVECEKFEKGIAVKLIGKKELSDQYASDFYKKITHITGTVLFSGKHLSSQGFGIWNNLLLSGSKY